ncbi:hypothetical protein [Pseudoduganella albidiflava]|uniref:Uncharacterized protein n=1 Tax=Pseudoduganella albidiflava TaxID=321983 RepID=A0ABX5RUQ8_9BURK|nr:hypothetical protein [Pseudoduganella albidiflava]QBI02362.1 hypothetical protein EYF70_17085 [Pseudoduganella albidiflava]
MTTPRQHQPAKRQLPASTSQASVPDDELDEALDESFPASDPVAVSITHVDMSPTRPAPAPAVKPRSRPR